MSVSESNMSLYKSHKAAITDAQKKHGSAYFSSRPAHDLAGLWNQGATCYLNSLLQAFFMDDEFRAAVHSSTDQSPVLLELKRLFAMLKLSRQVAISTKDLTSSFGWSSAQSFEQHDAHELFSLLLDILSGGPKSLFEGSCKDSLSCPTCSFQSSSSSPFINISIDIPDTMEIVNNNIDTVVVDGADPVPDAQAARFPLQDLLQQSLQPEELDCDNVWECGKCAAKVQALKAISYESPLPKRLMVQLKRFRFDPISRRRRKLTSAVLFPPTLSGKDLGVAEEVKYELSAVLVHTGTALGGHYRAYVRDAKAVWFDFNDAIVSQLDGVEQDSLLWFNGENGKEKNEKFRDILYENAYMLMYRQVSDTTVSEDIAEDLKKEVEAKNAEIKTLQDAYDVMKNIAAVTAYVHRGAKGVNYNEQVSVDLMRSATVSEMFTAVYDAAIAAGYIDSSVEKSNCRLRKFNSISHALMETFTGMDDKTLLESELEGQVIVCVEIKSSDVEFSEYNPNEMRIRMCQWDELMIRPAGAPAFEGPVKAVVVPGDMDGASAGGLRSLAGEAFSVPVERINLIKTSCHSSSQRNGGVLILADDDKTLTKDYDINCDEEVIVEVLVEGQIRSASGEESTSVALEKLRSSKRNITIIFNHPTAEVSEDTPDIYTFSLLTSLDSALVEVKKSIAEVLKLEDSNSFHVRRNNHAPQLKDEKKTLGELEFVNQSVLHLQMGIGCKMGEFLLKFEIDVSTVAEPTAAPVNFGELKVREKMTVAAVKELVLKQWSSLQTTPAPATIQHIRLKDGKSKTLHSGPLREERMISRCLLNLEDGRKIVMQILAEPEVIGPDDVILSLRVASYYNKTLSKPVSLPVARSTTVTNLYEMLLAKYPALQESEEAPVESTDSFAPATIISIAKGFTTGPVMTLKSALKLKWNDEAVLKDVSLTIDKSAWNLRDGSLIVLRGQADFERAKAVLAAEKKRLAESGEVPEQPARRPGTRGLRYRSTSNNSTGDLTKPATKEKSLRIVETKSSGDILPPSSPVGGEGGDEPLPSAPVRVIKALKEGASQEE